jgi:hypothetical protein
MKKSVFTLAEAAAVDFEASPALLKLNLHNWMKAGDLRRVKRGVYALADAEIDKTEIARAIYAPCYVSLEYALHSYGILPDVPFGITLVTPKATRSFETAFGLFTYQKLRRDLFFGFDPSTLLGRVEKCLLDYLYLNSAKLRPEARFWEEMRMQHLDTIDFDAAFEMAPAFGVRKIIRLLEGLRDYAATSRSH